MSNKIVILLAAFSLALFDGRADAISCYVCSSTSTDLANPCNPPLNAANAVAYGSTNSTSNEVVYYESGCTSCETATVANSGVTTYARACVTTTTTTSNQCQTSGSSTTCVSFCTTGLCNTGSDASTIRFTLLSLILASILSVAAKSA